MTKVEMLAATLDNSASGESLRKRQKGKRKKTWRRSLAERAADYDYIAKAHDLGEHLGRAHYQQR